MTLLRIVRKGIDCAKITAHGLMNISCKLIMSEVYFIVFHCSQITDLNFNYEFLLYFLVDFS